MFSIGNDIVYGSMGVCKVTDIGVPDLPGANRSCYVLKPHFVANSKVYAPVENNPVPMRLLLTPAEMRSLIDAIPALEPFAVEGDKQGLHDICREAVRSADCHMLARLIKTLYEKKLRLVEQKKNVPSAEKEYFDTAEKVLYGEMAVVLDIPMEDVREYIALRLEGASPALS